MKCARDDRRRRGTTLVLVTTIGVIIGILGVSMIQLGYSARVTAVRDVEKVDARCAADAGLAEALTRMQERLIRVHDDQTPWPGPIGPGSGTLPGTITTYSYQVTANIGYHEIVSTGTCGTASRTVHAILKLDSYAEGIGVDTTVDAKNSTYFGIVGPGTIADMKIRSNSTDPDAMIFRTNVRVDGDVFCGPGGTPSQVVEVKQNVTITGQVGSSPDTMVWPPVPVPTNLVTNGPVLTGTMTLPQGRYQYGGNLSIPNGSVISIERDLVHAEPQPTVIYVPEIMTLGQGVEIIVKSGANLEVYIGQQLRSGNATGFGNENTDARTLRIYGLPTCDYIDLKTKSSTYACLYAPEADVDLYNSGDFFGSITADSFEMKNSGNFYFDTKLKDVKIDDLLARFVIARWWED